MALEDKIKELKKNIEEAKQEKAENEGAIKNMMERLKNEFELASLNQAEKRIGQLEKEIEITKSDLETEYEALRQAYDW